MPSFADLKNRHTTADLEALTKKIVESQKGTYTNDDDGDYYPKLDKAGNAVCILRFMPAPPCDGENALPWVKYYDHAWKGPGGWYIEKSLTTLNQPDPCTESNNALWESGIEANRKLIQGAGPKNPGRKRRLHYKANVLVEVDKTNPENEGKVFPFKFGKKIFQMIQDQIAPDNSEAESLGTEPKKPVNVFDFWKGASFKFSIRKVDGQTNYDKSEFRAPSALFDGDEEKLEALYNSLPSLTRFVAPEKFKTYDQLKARLNKVLGGVPSTTAEDEDLADAPSPKTATPKAGKTAKAANIPEEDADDEDGVLKQFADLVNDDD